MSSAVIESHFHEKLVEIPTKSRSTDVSGSKAPHKPFCETALVFVADAEEETFEAGNFG